MNFNITVTFNAADDQGKTVYQNQHLFLSADHRSSEALLKNFLDNFAHIPEVKPLAPVEPPTPA